MCKNPITEMASEMAYEASVSEEFLVYKRGCLRSPPNKPSNGMTERNALALALLGWDLLLRGDRERISLLTQH